MLIPQIMNQKRPTTNSIVRQQRKNQHLELALELPDGPGSNCFEDILLQPEALPELSLSDVDITTHFCGLALKAPLLINAITGGTRESTCINARLAQVAKQTGLPLAVGSQKIALDDPTVAYSFQIVRRIYPKGIIFANLGAGCSVYEAQRAVDMLDAQGLQLHLNVAQEMAMAEGDRSFYWDKHIAAVAQGISVPVIAKEVGSGITGPTAQRLLNLGVAGIDIGGSGGTNFVTIEYARRGNSYSPLNRWGLPTAWSLLDVLGTNPDAEVCATGGMRNGLEIAKALALGARVCGAAKPFLQAVTFGGVKSGVEFVHRCLAELKSAMVLVGAKDLASLRQKPILFNRGTFTYLQQRKLTEIWTCR